MSIKKLFDSSDTSRNFLSDSNEKEAFQEIESADNLRALQDKQDSFVPHINYRKPENFAKFGSAYLYYKGAIERIIDFYPYDGSDAEINEFYNKSLNIEKYIFNNLYPRTNGYVKLSSDGWGTLSGSLQSGYGLPSSLEYIDFTGGPHTISETATTKLFLNPSSSNPQASNIYDTSIYTSAGLPSDYGSGTRESNLRANFDTGVSVEFWVKSGSMSTALTNKQVVVDLWNNELSSSGYGGAAGANPNPHYGRITIALNGLSAGSPFRVTAQSGATGIFEQAIGNDLKVNTLDNWKHYAIVMQNTGSDFAYRLYVDGRINDINYVSNLNINEINSKNLVGRLGSLLTAPSGAGGTPQQVLNMVGAGKFSGSIDEFRYWKVARSGKGIGKNWFTQVRGGTNTDIANTTLGIYYKFNEGTTGDSTIDKTILDYSGRVSNGTWTNYTANGRFSGSAIVEATASATEYKDPIIYAVNPDVSSLKKSLLKSGSYHDTTNNSSFMSLIPNWVIEEVEEDETNNVRVISHIMGTYFDKIHAWISAIPKFKNTVYTSASYSPYPFAEHLPQSLGLYAPELFVDADVLEKFLNRDETTKFEGDLTETKNLIYLNLYNNIANIYKAKGTEKSVRNIFRCFYMNDTVMRLNTYAHHNTFTLQNNLQQVRVDQTSLNFNSKLNLTGVVYQAQSGSSAESQGYISGSGPLGYEDKYGFTLEADVLFPRFFREKDKFDRNFFTASLFGLYSASVDPDLNNDTTFYATDNVNFQVYAVRDARASKNVYFKLSSSIAPFPIPILTSSVFFNTYDQERWNLSVRLKPSNYPLTDIVTGSEDYTYDLVFRGVNPELGSVQNSFVLTASLSKVVGRNLLRSAKRAYVGARKTNITGAILNKCDVVFNGLRYWTKYLEDTTLNQHIFDVHNRGISGSYQNYAVKDPTLANNDVLNLNAIALDWSFDDITGSNTTGNFYVTDFSSGSALLRDNFKWVGDMTGYQHTGYGSGFPTSSSDPVVREAINSFKFIDPEMVISSEMIQILSEDDKVFDITETVPSYKYTLEKSMYNAISEEMLQFFAGVIDFNNVIGDPVNRYRARYKALEKLREIFFRRVTTTSKVEKFIDYYKWFDDAISQVIAQMLPASSDFLPDTLNTIESHVLERNKYKTAFPTIEMKPADPEGIIEGVYALTYPYITGSTPLPSSPRLTSQHKIYWQQRAERGAPEITSGDSTVDQQRNKFRDVIYNTPHLSQSYPVVSTIDGDRYSTRKFTLDRLAKTYNINAIHKSASYAQGGVNFGGNKNIQLTYNALYPFGPVNTDGGVYIPENVLVAFTDDMVKLDETVDISDVNIASASYFFKHLQKHKRYMGVQHGREWERGLGYYNLKSSRIFPFNIISPGVNSGFNKRVIDRVTASIQLTNLHNDVYGDDMEVPMQGPFTDYAVGGHQSRHIALNKSSSAKTYYVNGLDSYLSRPEAWKILLGMRTTTTGVFGAGAGALGMAGPDYPWPEANALGVRPYPMTGSQRATYYRDFIAKRPVNIRNIQMKTGSTILGNYSHNYELVSSVGAYSNPRNFVENQPTLPIEITETPSASQGRLFTDIHRTENGHIELIPSYSIGYLTGATNKSIITSRFSNPGGIETMGIGYMDIRAAEYSVYNVPNYRNLTVLKPSQGPSGTISQPTGSGTPGIRVYDVIGKDYGLYANLSRHSAKFGRNSSIYPSDSERGPYSLNQPFVGYSGLKTYRGEEYLQGWWRLRENVSSAGTAKDSSDSGVGAGTFAGASSRPAYSTALYPSIYVQTASCTFDASANKVAIGGAGTWNLIIGAGAGSTKQMTFSAWVYKTGDGGNNEGRILTFGDDDIFLYTNSVERVLFEVGAWSGTRGLWNSNTTGVFALNSWTHIAVTYDVSSTTNDPLIYVNGVLDTLSETSTPVGTYGGIQTAVSYIGNRNDGAYGFAGQLSDVAVWNSILTSEEIKAIYNASKLPEIAGPGASYQQAPSYQKVNRNTKRRLKWTERFGAVTTASVYDNWSVQYQIPRSDKQYAWITESLSDPTNERYMGFCPLYGDFAGWHSTSAGYVSFFDFVSASEIGNQLPNFYQPTTSRLNIYTLDPVTGATDNVIGFATGINTSSYFNNTLLNKRFYGGARPAVSRSVTANGATYFNLLMTRRGNTFGWGWNSSRQEDNPILRAERNANEITLMQEDRTLYRYSMRPVNSDGRPALININAPISAGSQTKQEDNNFTLKVGHKGLDVRFSDTGMDDFLSAQNIQTEDTPLEQIIRLTKEPLYTLNWLLYVENLFPSVRNAYKSSSIERTDYDNKFWRDNLTARVSVGATVPNSYNINPYAYLSQSCWPLDAQEDFLTRTGPPTASVPSEFVFSTEGKAGELQNNYFSYFTGAMNRGTIDGITYSIKYNAPRMLRPAALYAKKHMITTLRSPVSPTGPAPIVSYDADAGTFSGAIAPYAGEAKWEANTLAGIVVKNVKKAAFQTSGSDPFFNDYDDFKYDLKLIAKDYSIIPEFRISEHVEDYVKFGISNTEKTDTFEIPGTLHNSSTSSFYKDYSNSEFMTEFLNIKDQIDLTGTEIKLVCSAAIRLNPYKGFYPAQRTLDLVSQFSSSYGESLYGRAPHGNGSLVTYGFPKFMLPARPGGSLRPIVQPLFNPGILYNSIKSGIGVDYPVVTDITKVARAKTDVPGLNYYGVNVGNKTDNWAITSANSASLVRGAGYAGSGSMFWDQRIPFEAIMEPENYLDGLELADIEPHPSMSLEVTGTWNGGGDEVYTLMAKNFFGEVANFFLKDQVLTRLESGVITDGTTFQSGSIYGARIKIRRSTTGPRSYEYESGSAGDNEAYSRIGGRLFGGTGGNAGFKLAGFPLPQDPRQNPFFKENFTMYSRPSAFGPAVGGRPVALSASYNPTVLPYAKFNQVLKAFPVDSFNGFNWGFTPPYYNGEAWVDIIFKPQARTEYNLDSILSEARTFYRRVDPGYDGMNLPPYGDSETALLSSFVTFSGSKQTIYGGHNVNANAMQISSSINLFGVQSVPQQRTGKAGQLVESVNTSEGKKWIIQPKWETPMLNFNDTGTRGITSSAGTLTLPSNYGTGSVSQGMWHQFGIIDPDPKKGVFLEIGDIPTDWLKFHYDVVNNDTYYNDFDASNKGGRLNKRMKSLLEVVGFNKKNSRIRLGQMAEEIILREAVVAIPYILESVDNNTNNNAGGSSNTTKKSFIDIPMARYEAALAGQQGSLTGDSLEASGESIRKLVQKMNRFILPPQFDFVNNGDVDPIVMYMFEFQYKLDKDDLAYIWQNLAPRNYKRLDLVAETIAHDLGDTQLLSEKNIFDNENLRWMLFKVKQRSQANYDDLIADQAESSTTVGRMGSQGAQSLTTGLAGFGGSIGGGSRGSGTGNSIGGSAIAGMSGQSSNQSLKTPQASTEPSPDGYPIAFNWPYDYISFVEMVKFDAQILFKDEEEPEGDVIEGQGQQGQQG